MMDQVGKNRLRTEMQEKRMKLNAQDIALASQAIGNKLAELEPLKKALTIMAFCPIRNEVDLSDFFTDQQNQGKKIFLPRINSDGELEAAELRPNSLRRGTFGIPEPIGEVVPPETIDAVLVPGLVFDGGGYRLGYGKGYYDRFLSMVPARVFKCGVCYEFQVVDNIYPREKDIPMHWVVTDRSELVIDWNFF
jgi:5-formyltetrahydrofolate cyclo-ligase